MSEVMDGSNELPGFDGIEPALQAQVLDRTMSDLVSDRLGMARIEVETDEQARCVREAGAYMQLGEAGANTVEQALDLLRNGGVDPAVVAGWFARQCEPTAPYFLRAIDQGYPALREQVAEQVAENDQAKALLEDRHSWVGVARIALRAHLN